MKESHRKEFTSRKRDEEGTKRSVPEKGTTRRFGYEGENLTEAEAIALKMLEKRRHDRPKEKKPVTIRRFSWESKKDI